MTSEAIGGIVRAVLAALGGYLVGKGYFDQAAVNELVGAGVVIATGVWSVLNKRKLTAQ